MARPSQSTPTERELLLLKLLWQNGASTVKDLHKWLPLRPKPAYNSVQTNLLAMLEKGYISRDTSGKTHVFEAVLSQEEVEQKVVAKLLKSVFNGSAFRLLSAALNSEQVSSDELERLQALLDAQNSHD